MQITVFGAGGKVGRLVTAQLLADGHDVVAFVHRHGPPPAERLRFVHGSVDDRASVEAALNSSDAVVSALGSWGTKSKNIVSTGMEKIIPAMQAAGIRRIVSLTGNASMLKGEHFGLLMQATHTLFNMFQPKILRDGEDHLAMLAASGLDWTVVRSPVMAGGQGRYALSAKPGSQTIPRSSVAAAMASLVTSDEQIGQAPFITRMS